MPAHPRSAGRGAQPAAPTAGSAASVPAATRIAPSHRRHRPFTSDSAEGQAADTWWKLLYAHHATLILNGHDHVYSRFAPMDPGGNYAPRRGIREFIIGTGGEALDTLVPGTPNLQASSDQYYGVMKFTLRSDG